MAAHLHPLDAIRNKLSEGDKPGALGLLKAHLVTSPYAYSWMLFGKANTPSGATNPFLPPFPRWHPLVGDDPYSLSLYLLCARECLRQGASNPAQLTQAKSVLEAAVRTPLLGGVDALQLLEEAVVPSLVSAGLVPPAQAVALVAESKGAFYESQRVLLSEGEWPMRVRTGSTELLVGRDAEDEDEGERLRAWSTLLQRMFATYTAHAEKRDDGDAVTAKKWSLKAAHQLRRIQLAMKQALDQCPKADPLAVHYVLFVGCATGSVVKAREALQQVLSRTGSNLASSPCLLALQVGLEKCASIQDLFASIGRHAAGASADDLVGSSVSCRSQQGFGSQMFDVCGDVKAKKAIRDVGKQQDKAFEAAATTNTGDGVNWGAIASEIRNFYSSWIQLEHGQLLSTQLATEVGRRATQRMLKVISQEEMQQAALSSLHHDGDDEGAVIGEKRPRATEVACAEVAPSSGPSSLISASNLFAAEVRLHSSLGDTIRAKDTAASSIQTILGSDHRGGGGSEGSRLAAVPMGLADTLFRQQLVTERKAGINTAPTYLAHSLYRRGDMFGQRHNLNNTTSVMHLEAKFRPVGGMALYPLGGGKELLWGRLLDDAFAMEDRFADDSGQWLRPEILLKRRRIEPVSLESGGCSSCSLTVPCGCARWVPIPQLPQNPPEHRIKVLDQGNSADLCAPRAMRGTLAHNLVVDKRTVLRLRRELDRRALEEGRDKATFNEQMIENLPGSLFRVAQAVPPDTEGVGNFVANVSVMWLLDTITGRSLDLKVPVVTKANPNAALGALAPAQTR